MKLMGERYEIYIGMGNAYYNDKEYYYAYEHFMKAASLEQTEKVYENSVILAT